MSDTLGGYAPGDYSCTCTCCGDEFSGDKRAVTCLQCAGKEQFNAGLERAAEELCKRGARMQLLKEFMQSRKCNSLANYWEQYCNINPEAETWFDNDGVPSKEISND